MSTDAGGSDEQATATLRSNVVTALREGFPQLRGAPRAVRSVDPESGIVTLSFGCGCSGGVSEATKAAIEAHLVEAVEGVSGLQTESGCGCGHGGGRHRGGHGHGSAHGHGNGNAHGHGNRNDSGSDEVPEAPF